MCDIPLPSNFFASKTFHINAIKSFIVSCVSSFICPPVVTSFLLHSQNLSDSNFTLKCFSSSPHTGPASVIFAIQNCKLVIPQNSQWLSCFAWPSRGSCASYVRVAFSLACGTAATLAFLVVALLFKPRIVCSVQGKLLCMYGQGSDCLWGP